MPNQLPNQLIDIRDWTPDEEFAVYPEGSRTKRALRCPDPAPFSFLIPRHRYLFKQSSHRYPAQFWAEIIAYRLGELAGVAVPPAFAAHDSRDGQPAALIEWFYGYPGRIEPVRYVSGANYMKRMIRNFDEKKGRQHNWQAVHALSRFLENTARLRRPWHHWASVFTFDALIGNTDRHQANWGVLWLGGKAGEMRAEFSPAFDNGTSLGHEIMENKLAAASEIAAMDRYIAKGCHHIKQNSTDQHGWDHAGLLLHFRDTFPATRETMLRCLAFDEGQFGRALADLTRFDVRDPFTDLRSTFVHALVRRRRDRLQNILNS